MYNLSVTGIIYRDEGQNKRERGGAKWAESSIGGTASIVYTRAVCAIDIVQWWFREWTSPGTAKLWPWITRCLFFGLFESWLASSSKSPFDWLVDSLSLFPAIAAIDTTGGFSVELYNYQVSHPCWLGWFLFLVISNHRALTRHITVSPTY